jgi:hypothetical protein
VWSRYELKDEWEDEADEEDEAEWAPGAGQSEGILPMGDAGCG